MDRLNPPRTVRPPPQRRAFSTIVGPVEVAGAPDEANALGALFDVEPALERALTHGFHSYAGRMHPSIARAALARFSPAGGKLLDPFCGSGTVLVEGMAAGRTSVGIDASPLATMIAKVRSRVLGDAGRTALVTAARQMAELAMEEARKRRRPEVPRWAEGEFKVFHPHVALELLGLRSLVMATPAGEPQGQALRLCLSSILVKFMKSGPEAPRDGADKRIGRGVPSRFFADRAAELARGLAELEMVTPAGTPAPDVRLGDAREYPHVGSRSIDLVLCSPPYAGVYDYAEHHAVRFRWLGLPTGGFRQRQLGERNKGVGTAVSVWQEGRRRFLAEMARVLRPDGAVILVVGDGVVGDQPEDAATAIATDAEAAGLSLIARASQGRPTRDTRLRAIFGETPRREHILLLRR